MAKAPKKPRAGASLKVWENYDSRKKKFDADEKKRSTLKNRYS